MILSALCVFLCVRMGVCVRNTIHARIHRQILSNSLDGEHLMHAHAYIFTHMFTCHNTNPYLIISRCWNGNTASQRVNTRHKIQFYTNTYARSSPTCGIYQCKIYTHSNRSQTHAQSPLPALTHTHARHTWLLRSRNTEQEKKKKTTKTSTSGE